LPTVTLTFATDCNAPARTPVADRRVLGAARLGVSRVPGGGAPCQDIPAPLLGHVAPTVLEQWLCDADCRDGEAEGIRFRRAGNVLYGVLVADEADFAGATPLRAAAEDAYRRIFALLDGEGLPHLWRVWNYLADINGEQDGLERYRQFNVGRQDAFLASGRLATGNVPAACAIGLADGPLRIAFLAGKDPAYPIENPRQVSAYNYPSEYGPRSPTFSRAALAAPGGQVVFFVSGTASIVGHHTLHTGDAAAQARESLANIAAVVAEANHCLPDHPFRLDALSYRAYIRHAADYPAVAAELNAVLGGAEIVCVQADICRADLLVEIEAVAVRANGSR
jgi:enamine deaminase RidA (YjgF/YER057c/UK114 family)